ncbi:uncharacterized protein LOC143452687 isoform X2 [Clavelina lepadiformis]|uniref:Uncharacterized protein n=1 Tax=Clavelina lepadiformis TaxID=159417 RepID=A0ABP0GUG4_CLALP
MAFDEYCRTVFMNGGPLVDYIYIGSRQIRWGELRTNNVFPSFSLPETSIITNSKGSNFVLRGEEYRFIEHVDGVFAYESPTRCLSFASTPEFILAACGSNGSFHQCQRAVHFGITWLRWFYPNGV